MGARNNDISLILAKAVKEGFFPDVKDSEVAILEKESQALFRADRTASLKGANSCLFQPSPTSLIRWRSLRQEVLAGKKQGHIAIMGDSIPFGAASTGASNPKWLNSYPGQLRTILNQKYGDAGSGLVLANPTVRTNPAWDTRFTFGGASFLDHAFGLFSSSAYRLNAASDATLDFTATADEFWVHTYGSGSGTFTIQVDAGTTHTCTTNTAGTGGTLAPEANYYRTANGGHNVFKVTTGSTASHVLKIRPGATGNVFVGMVEARINGNGKFRISNTSQSSKSMPNIVQTAGVINTGDDNGLTGLSPMDSIKADLLVMALGINDWQGQHTLANMKLRLETIIQRQRATANPLAGVVPAGGEIVLLWNPKPNTATLGGGLNNNPDWDAVRNLYYEVAEEQDVALIDLGGRWKDYDTANSFGMYADTIHPGDKGAGDIAGSVYRALFVEA